MKILLAVDGSKFTKKMLAYVSTHPELFSPDNDYTAFTAHTPLPPRARAAVGKDIAERYHADESEKILAPVCKFLARHNINAKSAWKVGAPGETIAEFAEGGKFDLVVIGSHGHGALRGLLMGSVVSKVIALTSIPALIVR
jgi:nucleotide-binding universal stress UspA family protein